MFHAEFRDLQRVKEHTKDNSGCRTLSKKYWHNIP